MAHGHVRCGRGPICLGIREAAAATKVSAVVTERPICVSPDDSVAESLRMLLAYKVGGLLVLRQQDLRVVLGISGAVENDEE